MTEVANFDAARAQQLYARTPNPLPPGGNYILVVGASWCPDSQQSMVNTGYATAHASRQEGVDPVPIYWIDDSTPQGHALLSSIPNAGRMLGAGVGPEMASRDRSNRGYNYPTAVVVQRGEIERILHSDTIPVDGLTTQGMIAGIAAHQQRNRWPGTDPLEARLRDRGALPAALQPNHLYMVVDRNCGHCRQLLETSRFPATNEAGVPITYVDLGTPEGRRFGNQHFGTHQTNDAQRLVQGWPAVVRTDAQGRPQVTAQGVPEILREEFPRIAQANPTLAGAERPAEGQRPAAPPARPGTTAQPIAADALAAELSQTYVRQFGQLDGNRDGKIDRGDRGLADANRDGRIEGPVETQLQAAFDRINVDLPQLQQGLQQRLGAVLGRFAGSDDQLSAEERSRAETHITARLQQGIRGMLQDPNNTVNTTPALLERFSATLNEGLPAAQTPTGQGATAAGTAAGAGAAGQPGAAGSPPQPRSADANRAVYMSIRGLSAPADEAAFNRLSGQARTDAMMGRMTNAQAADIIERHIYGNGSTVSTSDRDARQGDHRLSTNEMGAFHAMLSDPTKAPALITELRAAGFLRDVPEAAAATGAGAAGAAPVPGAATGTGVATRVTTDGREPGEPAAPPTRIGGGIQDNGRGGRP